MPQEPGIYIYRDVHNTPLYIGKSKNLKARISSYFHSTAALSSKTRLFVSQIHAVDIITVRSEFEALLLEARLIQELKPKYNSRLRDDKSPIYIVVTTEEQFPRVLKMRRTDLFSIHKKATIFGPFLSSRQVDRILKHGRRFFPYCNQRRRDGRPCFYVHIGLCPGVCTKTITAQAYRRNIQKLIRFLRGDISTLRKQLKREMNDASAAQDYETAQEKKQLIDALDHTLSRPVTSEDELFSDQKTQPLQSLIKILTTSTVIPGSTSDSEVSTRNLYKNLYRFQHRAGMTIDSFRIEGYDISNLKGRQATGSMVVFTNGVSTSSKYRTFRIRGEDEYMSDDPRMLCEVLRRRLLHPEWDKPQLILIDGGEPQLRQIQKEFGITTHLPGNIPFIGLAKEEEILVIPSKDSSRAPFKDGPSVQKDRPLHNFFHLKLPRNDPGLLLLMHIRDEAHRFARAYHHWLRKKTILGENK